MKDLHKLRDLVVKTVDLAKVMIQYRVQFSVNPLLVSEAQIRCPFHGDDVKPSARYYRETQTMYCWVCQKKWDVVSFIMDKEQFKYVQAIKFIINKYKIDTSSIPDDPELQYDKVPVVSETGVRLIYLRDKIKGFRGKLPFEKYRDICLVLYMILFEYDQKINVLEKIKKFENKIGGLTCLS